jgi:hypothetical protein
MKSTTGKKFRGVHEKKKKKGFWLAGANLIQQKKYVSGVARKFDAYG